MQLTVIAYPKAVEGEATFITRLIQEGLSTFHVRKPEWSEAEYKEFLELFPEAILNHFIIHEHHKLIHEFPLKGLHFKSDQKVEVPANGQFFLSQSFHSLEALENPNPQLDRILLSPIFDSISKPGYEKAFEPEVLQKNLQNFQGQPEILALGGITADRLATVHQWGFDGAAVLGDLWEPFLESGLEAGISRFHALQNEVKKIELY